MTPEKALRLQKRMYQSLQQEALELLGKTPETIRQYERTFQQDFKVNSIQLKSRDFALDQVKNHDVVFFADFHTFHQAQRLVLKLLQQLRNQQTPSTLQRPWFLALELVSSQHQNILDAFQAGNLSTEAFHSSIQYNEEWGFPWGHYVQLFDWAKQEGIPLIALNRPKPLPLLNWNEELHKRDEWAAGLLTDLFLQKNRKSPRPLVFVVYGELHVGSRHLPQALSQLSERVLGKALRSLIFHQNHDALYWRAAKAQIQFQEQVVQLKKSTYCFFSGTPWAKIQSLIDFTEGIHSGSRAFLEENEEEGNTNRVDTLYWFRTYGELISEWIKLPCPTYDDLTIYSLGQPDFLTIFEKLEHAALKKGVTPLEMRLIEFQITRARSCYIPLLSAVLLDEHDPNATAELAAIHLFRHHHGKRARIYEKTLRNYYRQTLESAFGFLASLLLNPLRKCDLNPQHFQRISLLEKQLGTPGLPSTQIQALRQELLAREIYLHTVLNPKSASPAIAPLLKKSTHAPAIWMGARYVGRALGRRLHEKLYSHQLDWDDIRPFLLTKTVSPEEAFLQLLSAV
jgi:hypothetical protein